MIDIKILAYFRNIRQIYLREENLSLMLNMKQINSLNICNIHVQMYSVGVGRRDGTAGKSRGCRTRLREEVVGEALHERPQEQSGEPRERGVGGMRRLWEHLQHGSLRGGLVLRTCRIAACTGTTAATAVITAGNRFKCSWRSGCCCTWNRLQKANAQREPENYSRVTGDSQC